MANDDVVAIDVRANTDVTLKTCLACLVAKPLAAFPSDRNQCKQCRAATKRRRLTQESPERRNRRLAACTLYAKENPERLAAIKKRWNEKNPELVVSLDRARYEANRQAIRQKVRQWRINNPDRKRAANKAWSISNPEKMLESSRASKRKRRLDGCVRLFESISEQMRQALRGEKDGKRWESLVGYTRTQLVRHIERQFLRKMSWDNYGDWHIDHIVPASSFVYASVDDAEFHACWALTNLRPLWALDNIEKRDKRTHLL